MLAYDVGVMDGQYKVFAGDTRNTGDSSDYVDCGANLRSKDAFFKFTLNASTTITIDTAGSTLDTVIGVMERTGTGPEDFALVECNNDDLQVLTSKITRLLAPNDYVVWIKGAKAGSKGAYTMSFKDEASVASGNLIECDDDGGLGTSSEIIRTLSPGDYHVIVKGAGAAEAGAYSLLLRDQPWYDAQSAMVTCSDAPDSIEEDLVAGDYWFLVKGDNTFDSGNYSVRVQDVTNPPVGSSALSCSDDDAAPINSLIQQMLPVGDYYVVLKGDADADRGNYNLTIRDVAADVLGTVIECDNDSGEGSTSVIERTLDAGIWYVVVKGDEAVDEGAYKVFVRDVDGFNLIGCDADSGSGQASYLTADLNAGSYYVMVKGDGVADQGAYSLEVRDTSAPTESVECDDDGGNYNTSTIEATLDPGTYYLALKGFDEGDEGLYQLTVGGSTVTDGQYDPPTWSETLAELNARDVHVMSILSCQDDPSHGDIDGDCISTRAQANSLANATDTLGAGFSPLVIDIDSNGAGLSGAVVDGVAELASYLELDVSVQVVFDPDPNPGFLLTVKAIDAPGDGCNGLIGLEHQSCQPGATPRFQVEFENPLAAPVPINPDDPNGGYNFRAELIGNGQFIIDVIPIYIIPEDVVPNPPFEGNIFMEGQYWQDVTSPGCRDNNSPDWRNLSWDANIYFNTTVTFSACTGDSAEEFATCVPTEIATVTGGGSCATNVDCGEGFCDSDIGVCQIASVGTCADDSQCPFNATCLTDTCVFDSLPVYVGGVLENNYKTNLRMYIDLEVEDPFEAPPIVFAWDMTYLCVDIF